MTVAQRLLPPMPRPGPDDPGPFAFARPERVRGILEGAGFAEVRLEALDVPFVMSTGDVEEAVNFALAAGPLARQTAELEADLLERVRDGLREALAPRRTAQGVILKSGIWIVTARQSA